MVTFSIAKASLVVFSIAKASLMVTFSLMFVLNSATDLIDL